jgi:uncharacterized protein (TIGR03083 family)
MTTATPVEQIPAISRSEAIKIAAIENERMVNLMRSLEVDDWACLTDCPDWDVRDMAGHVVGMAATFASFKEFASVMRRAPKAAGDGPRVDGMTKVQVADRAGLSTAELVAEAEVIGPKSARNRGRVPGLLRKLPMKEEVGGVPETWRLGYLLDIILTRDVWMHRVDICRAVGREMVLTPEHDGRLVADVVAEWARRHREPFTLHLEGPAGGSYTKGGPGGEEITIDAVEFCRVLSGRAEGAGLLTQEVPF